MERRSGIGQKLHDYKEAAKEKVKELASEGEAKAHQAKAKVHKEKAGITKPSV